MVFITKKIQFCVMADWTEMLENWNIASEEIDAIISVIDEKDYGMHLYYHVEQYELDESLRIIPNGGGEVFIFIGNWSNILKYSKNQKLLKRTSDPDKRRAFLLKNTIYNPYTLRRKFISNFSNVIKLGIFQSKHKSSYHEDPKSQHTPPVKLENGLFKDLPLLRFIRDINYWNGMTPYRPEHFAKDNKINLLWMKGPIDKEIIDLIPRLSQLEYVEMRDLKRTNPKIIKRVERELEKLDNFLVLEYGYNNKIDVYYSGKNLRQSGKNIIEIREYVSDSYPFAS